jgi:hypothetical protein
MILFKKDHKLINYKINFNNLTSKKVFQIVKTLSEKIHLFLIHFTRSNRLRMLSMANV